ncbi:MAG TPA: hypothetical protein VMF08_19500, partial [Candidatus Sulfotelmatobacter sp.]|nr:hypothetical protein [Candidatus Sulfotelmatobacter sp.]
MNITTPDGLVLHTTPVAIGLYDGDNGNSIIIAAVTNCSGTLISSNQVVYMNAFDNAADIIYTLKRDSFSQDVVLKQNIDPADYGCSSNSLIQIFTEFYKPPEPTTSNGNLRFGQLVFGQGRAYTEASTNQTGSAPVKRDLETINGQSYLVESVKYSDIRSALAALPRRLASSANGTKHQSRNREEAVNASKAHANGPNLLKIPSPHPAAKATFAIKTPQNRLADAAGPKGVVIDYVVLDGTEPEPMIFNCDTTYFISGEVDCYDVIFEGGTVLKYPYNTTPAQVNPAGFVTCATGPYLPAVFTAVDDDSIGESMNGVPGSGYTGTIQSGGYAAYALDLSGGQSQQLENCRFCFCQEAVTVNSTLSPNVGISLYDCQILNSAVGVDNGYDHDGYVLFANCLLAYVNTAAEDDDSSGDNLYCYDSTFDNCGSIYNYIAEGSTDEALVSVNSIFSNSGFGDGPNYGDNNGFYNCGGTFGDPAFTDPNSPYTIVGGGSYYLADNTFRGQGTTNIDQAAQDAGVSDFEVAPAILADLRTKTTWPPILYTNVTFSTNATFNPCVPRDTNSSPDIGWHYAPIDYVVNAVTLATNTSLTLSPGTALGWFGTGIELPDGAQFNSTGTATELCRMFYFDCVQEGIGSWEGDGTNQSIGIELDGDDSGNFPQVNSKFTQWSGCALMDEMAFGLVSGIGDITDCEFYNGYIDDLRPSANFTNCLFFRNYLYLTGATNLSFINSTFIGGYFFYLNNSESAVWRILNCPFDGTAFEGSDHYTNSSVFDYNAYNTNNLDWQNYSGAAGTLIHIGVSDSYIGPHDVIITNGYNWQTNWFGDFYLPSDSPLIEAGSTNASLLGLYHFTVSVLLTPARQGCGSSVRVRVWKIRPVIVPITRRSNAHKFSATITRAV